MEVPDPKALENNYSENSSDIIEPQELNYGIPESLRAIRFEIDAAQAEIKYVLRKGWREMRVLLNPVELMYLFFLIGLGLISFFLFTAIIIPVLISLIPGDPFEAEKLYNIILNVWLSDTVLRVLIGGVGALGILIRLLFRSDIDKFNDKVNSRSDLTYVFGSTIYAEKLIELLVFELAYEDQAALISDTPYLWVERIAGFIDTYTVKNNEEFEKSNLYKIIGFNNAKRVLILTDDIERNQNILTNLRALHPELPIYILSQFTPQYLKTGELVKDDHLFIIDDLENTREALVKSLSLNINFPDCTEINVPRNYAGLPARRMTKDLAGIEVLAVRRPNVDDDEWVLLSADDTILQRTDRVILYVTWDFGMKRINRVNHELPIRHLIDLGEIKVEEPNGKIYDAHITDEPGRSLLVEPKGTRKSWQRRLIAAISTLILFTGLILGRNQSISSYAYIFFFSGILGLLLAYWLHPLPQRGIMLWSKDEKTFLKKNKTFSFFGTDFRYSFEKATQIIVNIGNVTKKLQPMKEYYLIDKEGNKFHSINLVSSGIDSETVIKRFELRLKAYTGLSINEITK